MAPTSSSTTIRKVVIRSFSIDPEVSIAVVSAEIPAPAAKEVQVSVLYSGFSGADINMARGTYPMQRSAPLTPGYCMVGRVVSAGSSCHLGFKEGDLVTALTVYDSQAERINVNEKHLVRVPEGVDIPSVPALTLDWNTAYGMVEHASKVQKGQSVFIHGLSGAVGYATMILCLMKGATVYGTASKRNHAALQELGAHPFVYTDKEWIKAMKELGGVNAAFDPLGFESWDESYSILATDRPSVLVGFGGNKEVLGGSEAKTPCSSRSPLPNIVKLMAQNLKIWSKKNTVFYYIERDSKDFVPDLEALMELSRAGKITVPIKGVWSLDEVKEAHKSWSKKEGMGSMLIKVSG